MATRHGTAGDDTLAGTKHNDLFDLSQGGHDTANGGKGDDVFHMAGAFDAGDRLDGGIGEDLVTLDGDYTGPRAVTLAVNTLMNIESMALASGHSYTLDFSAMSFVLNFTVEAGGFGAGDVLRLTTGGAANFYTNAGAGTDLIHAGASTDIVDLTLGGSDTVIGSGPNFVRAIMGATMDVSDTLTHVDEIDLDGNYTGLGALNLHGNVVDAGYFAFGADHDYDITASDAVVAAGVTCIVDAGNLSTGHGMTFDGSAEKRGAYDFIGSFGNDVFEGGAKNDTFELDRGNTDRAYGGDGNDIFNFAGTLQTDDVAAGGRGNDTVRLSEADYNIVLKGNITGIETLALEGPNSFTITTVDANVAKGAVMTIDTSGMPINHGVTFDGSAERNGAFHYIGHTGDGNNFTGGTGDDVVTAVADSDYDIDFSQGGNDTFDGVVGVDTNIHMGGSLTADDRLSDTGGVILDGSYAGKHKLVLNAHTFLRVGFVELTGGHDYDITLNAASVGGTVQEMEFIGSALIHNTFRLDGSATHVGFIAVGGQGSDTLIGGSGNDNLQSGGGGNDNMFGGGGDDAIQFDDDINSGDNIDGGAGNDTVIFGNGTDLNYLLTAKLTNVETFAVFPFANYLIQTTNNVVAAGKTLTVDATGLQVGSAITFDGRADHDSNFHFLGGDDGDEFDGGFGNDVIDGGLSGDLFRGGKGNDTYVYHSALEATSLSFDAILDFDVDHDHFNIHTPVNHVVGPVFGGNLDAATFDSEIAAAMNGHLGKHQAAVFNPATGNFAGAHMLIIDANNVAGYQPGGDYVISVNFADATDSMFI